MSAIVPRRRFKLAGSSRASERKSRPYRPNFADCANRDSDSEVIRFPEILARKSVLVPMAGFVTASPVMKETLDLVYRIGLTSASVLILGETGVGKELVMRFMAGKRKSTIIDCGSLPFEIAESQLFGHRRGSFTGAVTDQTGLLDAPGSVIGFDEVAKLPINIQPKLLRFLDKGSIRRLGDQEVKTVTGCQIAAATNCDLKSMVASGQFLPDLFYRLDRVRIEIPPLRKRPEDIEALTAHIGGIYGMDSITAGALAKLKDHDWPGNVRELENVVSRARFKTAGLTIRLADIEF